MVVVYVMVVDEVRLMFRGDIEAKGKPRSSIFSSSPPIIHLAHAPPYDAGIECATVRAHVFAVIRSR